MTCKRPWMPFYVADYIMDTRHLTTIQHGAYLLLILHYWVKGRLPKDDLRLAQIVGMSARQWRAHRDTIAEFFDSEWRHKRIDKELRSIAIIAEARATAGAKGGRAKALKNKESGVAIATDLLGQKASNCYHTSHLTEEVESYTEVETHIDKSEIDNLPRAKKSPARFFPKDGFDRFWQIYPRKVAKEAARKSFEKVLTAGKVTFDELLTVVERFRDDPGCDPEFIPHPTTWLNQGRYLDDRLQAPPGMVEVERGKPYFEPLRRRFNDENGGEPQATANGALLPSKWVQIAKDYTDEQDRLLHAGNGLCEAEGSVGRRVSRH